MPRGESRGSLAAKSLVRLVALLRGGDCGVADSGQPRFLGSVATSPIEGSVNNRSKVNADTSALRGSRLALVVGNGRYQSRPLRNPENDTDDVSASLGISLCLEVTPIEFPLGILRVGGQNFQIRGCKLRHAMSPVLSSCVCLKVFTNLTLELSPIC